MVEALKREWETLTPEELIQKGAYYLNQVSVVYEWLLVQKPRLVFAFEFE